MFRKTRVAACTAVIAALAIPVTSASAATTAANDPGTGSPSCPANYTGPTNLATGCPWWTMVDNSGAPYPWFLTKTPMTFALK